MKVFEYLQSFSVERPSKLIRALLEEDSASNIIDSASLDASDEVEK